MYKHPLLRSQINAICLGFASITLVACSDNTTLSGVDGSDLDSGPTTTTDGSSTPNSGNSDGNTAGNDTPPNEADTDGNAGDTPPNNGDSDPETPVDTETETDNGNGNGNGNNPDPTDPGSEFPPVKASGADISGSLDDSPTETESASINGPFIKDTNRSAGPPSVPEGLVMLMAAENWLEFSWKPSTDDQSVEAYEIFRDGNKVHTVQLAAGANEVFDWRSWISTSYQDCNYTRYTTCDENPIVPGSSYEYRVVAVDNEGMKSAPSEPATFQLAVQESGPADLTGYVQVFGDEFNGNGLDRTKWKTVLPWGENTIINGEKQFYVNTFGSEPFPVDPFVFTGSTLQITATQTPADLLSQANNQGYLSGVITSSDNFKMTYGYVEMNAKLAGGQGFLSTFFLFNQDYNKNRPEIDIIEYIGDRPDKAYQTYHYYNSVLTSKASDRRHSSPTMETKVATSDLSAGFHTYSVLWEPGLVVWYIDGEEVRRLVGARVSDEPMNIIVQLVAGSEWIGEPDTTRIPNTYEIDYIRAYQKQ